MKLHNQGVITYKEANKQRIYAFVTGNDEHLHVNYWDGQWHWADQGAPLNSKAADAPGVITYPEAGKQRIYAFVRGANGHLFVNYWDGFHWHWADQGTPPGTTVSNVAGVITYREDTQPQRIYAFVRGVNGHLFVNYWDGSHWHWADQGTPPSTTVDATPGVITYREGTQPQRIYAFVKGANGHLYVNYWDGSNWHWANQGTPPGTTVADAPGVITYREGTQPQRIYAFVNSANGHLYVNYWDGFHWHWADQGTPLLTYVAPHSSPGVITYPEAGKQRIYAFVTRKPSDVAPVTLNVNYWDGSQWHWADQGGDLPPATPGVITYQEGGKQRIYAFLPQAYVTQPALGYHLIVNYWDGSQWHWADQGTP